MRDGPILPENHPLVPEPVRDKLKILRLQQDLEVAELAVNRYRKKSSFARRWPFWITTAWAALATLAHFWPFDGLLTGFANILPW